MRLRYEPCFAFDDHKGFDAYLGQHCEGHVIWYGPTNENVLDGGREKGWHWTIYEPDGATSIEAFDTKEKCIADFERALFTK